MCWSAADATVNTPDNKPTALDKPMGDAPPPDWNSPELNNLGLPVKPPADPPTMSDGLVQGAAAAERKKLLSTDGRSSTFLTSPTGG